MSTDNKQLNAEEIKWIEDFMNRVYSAYKDAFSIWDSMKAELTQTLASYKQGTEGVQEELRKWVIEQRNLAHVNCLEEKKQAYNHVIAHLESPTPSQPTEQATKESVNEGLLEALKMMHGYLAEFDPKVFPSAKEMQSKISAAIQSASQSNEGERDVKWLDLTLSELVDQSLKKGVVPRFAFVDKDTAILQSQLSQALAEIEQNKTNEYHMRCAWDRTTQERDDLKAESKALQAIKKGLETSVFELSAADKQPPQAVNEGLQILVCEAAKYGFNYRGNSQHNGEVPKGNILQWLQWYLSQNPAIQMIADAAPKAKKEIEHLQSQLIDVNLTLTKLRYQLEHHRSRP